MGEVLPIVAPSRAELWRRHQLAKSLLSHRGCTPETGALVIAVLDGEQPREIEPLGVPGGGGG
ncbi:hypothetical protein [Amycolatopsis sp. NPDC051071]|uniref:hypothetical protein n=1 Tax=Amycolatopsis sp. NPDC051071 TaxID=3154637 RepID=UPI003414E5C6